MHATGHVVKGAEANAARIGFKGLPFQLTFAGLEFAGC